MPLPQPDVAQILLTLGTLAVALVAIWKVGVPVWEWCARKVSRISDLVAVFIGRPKSFDRVTGKEVAEVPSLVDALVQIRDKQDEQGAAVTTAIDNLTAVVTQVADQQVTLGEHTRQLADLRLVSAIHTEQIGMLKHASQERTAMHQESASLMDMVAKRDSDVIEEPEEQK